MIAPDEDARPDTSSTAQARLLAFIAHELRTPVTVAVGTLSMLESGRFDPLPPPQLHVVEMAMRSVAGVRAMADDMSLVARVARGEWPLHASAVAFDDIIADVAASLHESNPGTTPGIPSDASSATAVVDRGAMVRAVTALATFVMREASASAVTLRIVREPAHDWLVVSSPGPATAPLALDLADVDPSTSGNGFALHAAAALLALHGLRAVRLDTAPDTAAAAIAFPR
jgi:K+-sensing histidine kinase KdpD